MLLLRRLLSLSVAVCVVVAGLAASVSAAGDYRTAIDIVFPTVETAHFSNDFANGRSGGRVHRSTDIFAPAGSPVYAARRGTVIWLPREESGNAGFAIQIRGDDGRVYAYYHLGRHGGRFHRAVARSVTLFGRVGRGQFIGRVGDSGNAAGGAPHLHFEIQDDGVVDPYGTNRRNPYNSLRRALGLSQDMSQPTPRPVTTSPVLKLGDRGPAVAEWQRQLTRSKRVGQVTADGVFGPGTERATINFQKSAGLGPSGLGVVGSKTRAAMTRVLGRSSAPTPPAPKPAPTKGTTTSRASAPILRLGSSGGSVKGWQRKLNRSGKVTRVSVDGDFGPGTHSATVGFQRSVGLGPQGLGVVGPNTRAAMRRVLRHR